MEDTRFRDASSPETIDQLNDERLRRSEEMTRGWRRNLMVLLLLVFAVLGYWALR